MGVSAVAVVESDTYTAAVYPPDAGTSILAADVTAGLQPLVNRTNHLHLHAALDTTADGAGNAGDFHFLGDISISAAGSLDVQGPIQVAGAGTITTTDIVAVDDLTCGDVFTLRVADNKVVTGASADFTRGQYAPMINEITDLVANPSTVGLLIGIGETATQMLRVKHGERIVSVTVCIDPDNGGSLPPTLPVLRLIKLNFSTGVETPVANVSDPTTPFGTYEAVHVFTLTPGTPEVVALDTYLYFVRLDGETGGGANEPIYWRTTYTVLRLDGNVDLT